jgi:hypothetical protein
MILRLLCIWLVFYSLLSSLILSNLKHELLNRQRSTIYGSECVNDYKLPEDETIVSKRVGV